MAASARKPQPQASDPALIWLVEALARWDADRDYAAAQQHPILAGEAEHDPSRPLRPL